MGLEWLDTVFRIEKQFKIRIHMEAFLEWEGSRPVRHRAAEMTCLQLCECLDDPQYRLCVACRYPLKGLALKGCCRECGQPYAPPKMPWEVFQRIVAAATQMPESNVLPHVLAKDVFDAV